MTLMRAIGLMSGTSMDGIDVALVETDGESKVKRGPSMGFSYEPAFRRALETTLADARAMRMRNERPGSLAAVERNLTDRHADAVRVFLQRHGLETGSVDVIGFHGQTVLHRPESGLTVQLGEGQRLANALGIAVVYDMRANDMVHGGQGAPLVPAYHRALANNLPDTLRKGPAAFVNIGGISNVTWVADGAEPVAFDCGPGNALIDQWVEAKAGIPFDDGGAIASEGSVVQPVLDAYLTSSFFAKPGPKSLDRNDFTLDRTHGMETADGAATLAKLTAEAILRAADHMPAPPAVWIVSGGGARNRAIMDFLREGAGEAPVVTAGEAGFDADSMEAEAWAYLAVRALKGLPLTFPTTTGCREPVTGGVITRPVPLKR